MSDASELVVVSSHTLPLEAHLACSVLHAAGIEARVHDEYLVSAEWRYSNAIGGVKVVVRAEDFTTARELLESTAAVSGDDALSRMENEGAEQDVCPRCGSRVWMLVASGKWLAILSMFIGAFLLPVWHRWECRHCGYVAK
jgi:ribosomal protein S27AE